MPHHISNSLRLLCFKMPSPTSTNIHPRKTSTHTFTPLTYITNSSPHPQSTTTEPSFICTICWQPQYRPSNPSPSTFGPKLLGTSARIVCHPCWCAVLDLSICWVCGEYIVRGDEVVSLGWCFWHRACFGCLVCGTKMNVPNHYSEYSSESKRLRSWKGNGDEVGIQTKSKRCIGVELDEISLCGVCGIETAGESHGEVLERGLKTVSRFDGGLSRDRLGKLSEQQEEAKDAPRRLVRVPRRVRGATGIESELRRFINRSSIASMHRNVSLRCLECGGTI
jgi:hypothetical protein